MLADEFLVSRPRPNPASPMLVAVVARIEQLLQKGHDHNWIVPYEIERLLIQLKPPANLEKDVERRVSEAEAVKLDSAAKYRQQLTATNTAANAANPPPGIDDQRRAILENVTDDLQWNYNKRNIVRDQLWDAAPRLLYFGIVVFLVALLPFIAFVFERITGWHPAAALMPGFPNYGLFTAISFGLVGAFFSRLYALQTSAATLTVEDAHNLFAYKFILVRAAVGMFGAVIVYFILASAPALHLPWIVPDFSKFDFNIVEVHTYFMDPEKMQRVLVPTPAWGLLVVWSVIAGFSERFVPETLTTVEKRITGAAAISPAPAPANPPPPVQQQ